MGPGTPESAAPDPDARISKVPPPVVNGFGEQIGWPGTGNGADVACSFKYTWVTVHIGLITAPSPVISTARAESAFVNLRFVPAMVSEPVTLKSPPICVSPSTVRAPRTDNGPLNFASPATSNLAAGFSVPMPSPPCLSARQFQCRHCPYYQ